MMLRCICPLMCRFFRTPRALGLHYPAGLYSLSHVALPFPTSDALYRLTPYPAEDFRIRLGALAARGERNVLVTSLDALLRVASNPFFPYMIARIDAGYRRRADQRNRCSSFRAATRP